MGFLALLLMLFGVYCGSKLISRRALSEKLVNKRKQVLFQTAFSVAFRGAITPFLAYEVMYHVLMPLAVGTSIPEAYVLALVPGFFIYNITVPLYSIPVAFFVTEKIGKGFLKSNTKKGLP